MRCSVSTSPFAVAEHTAHVVSVAFPEATDDAAELYRAAVAALGPQLDPGTQYVRAGVTLAELTPRDEYATLDIFGTRPTRAPSAAVVDDIAAKFGEDTLGLGLAGLRTRRAWTMKRDMISPRATTQWDELAVVSTK